MNKMKLYTTDLLSETFSVPLRTIKYWTKKAKDQNQDHIIIKDKKYYFRNKQVGKGYEFCETPFNELSNSVEGLLKDDLNSTNNVTIPSTQRQKALDDLSEESKIKVNLKLAVIKAWDENKLLNSKVRLREANFIEVFKTIHHKDIELIGGKFSCTKKNIRDYKKAYEKDGIYGLIDKRGRAKGSSYKVKEWVNELVVELYKVKKGGITAKNIYMIVNSKAYEMGELTDLEYRQTISKSIGGAISITRIRDIINDLKNTREMRYLRNPDSFKNSSLPGFGDMRAKATYANHYWEIDSTQLDAFAKNSIFSKSETTWNLIAISDVKTGMKVIGIVKNSNSQGIAELLYKAFIKLGVPENIVTDNGKDYLSKHVIAMLERFGIGHVRTAPYAGEEKPFVERHFGTLQNSFTELLNGFKGHNVAEFKAINSQTATSDRLSGNTLDKEIETVAEISRKLDEWLDNVYSNTFNSSLNNTPYEAYLNDEEMIKRANIESLAFAFGKQIEVTVGKKGIRHDKKVYNNLDGVLGNKVGDDFIMIIDLLDHSKAYLFELDGTWICPVSTEKITKDAAIKARNFYRQDQKEMEKASRKLFEKHKNRDDINNILENVKEVFKDQTPIEMIGGNGNTQNSGNIAHLENIAKDIEKYQEKVEIINSEPDFDIHEKALEKYKEKKEEQKKDTPTISYDELILKMA